jgi:uncharacterized protein (TIGR03437 family)
VNAASNVAGGAAGEFISIFGVNMASTTRLWATKDFVNGALPTTLEGVSVTIDGKAAYVAYVSPLQLNIVAPNVTTVGNVFVTVKNNGLTSSTLTVPMSTYHPGLFLFKGNSVVAYHSDNVTPVGATGTVTGSTPAKPGETIVLWGTGLGPTTPPYPEGQILTTQYPTATLPAATIGGMTAKVTYAGLAIAGVYQINVTVPDTAPDGDLPVVVTLGGTSSVATATINVQH